MRTPEARDRGVRIFLCCFFALAWVAPATAEPEATSLDQLLERVRSGWEKERAENREREAAFRDARADQKRLLAEARAGLANREARSESLEQSFQDSETTIGELEETLKERLGTLGELFGVVRQVAGDTGANVDSSLVSAELPGRVAFLEELGRSQSMPSIANLEKLWLTLYEEMTESGKVTRFPATVVTADGDEVERDVIRVGAFNALSDGRYLRRAEETGKLHELQRQPTARHLGRVRAFEGAAEGMPYLSIDPSRGAILALLVQTPGLRERVEQGGLVGYTILGLGALAGLLGLVRLLFVLLEGRKVAAQTRREEASEGNALGRVMGVYEGNREDDPETLELKLGEAILTESSRLDRYLWAVKVVSVVAPLLGLLGTVTGMIRTFQAITLFGTGDPKLMAGGISEALVTTMLGLLVAIPLVLLHAFVTSSTRKISDVLVAQSTGMVAIRSEKARAA